MFSKNDKNTIDFEIFFKQFPLIHYERGEKVIRPSELSNNVMYVKKGFLKTYSVSPDGREIIINIINSELFNNCLIFGIADYINNYSIQALNDVQVWRAPKDKFYQFIKTTNEASEALLEPLSLCLENLYEQIEWLKNGDSYYKVASVLNYFGEQTANTENNTVTIGFKVTHQMIANLTGLTRETVTVQLNRLRGKMLIDYSDNIVIIKDVSGLKKEIHK